ncbi:MAG TPA: glycosyltransferase family 25 protein [Caldimonas sp.]|jgi:glycosyl transferase family 25|nr:glycosyltransferase family 25 protein [Caldimonas sp.]HEX2540187.1 glycosyltransferase family 25 protein [Caldimonas sp.]
MQIIVINLASQHERWVAASRQFEALGLRAIRFEAVDGSALGERQRATLYSEELNRRQYHKPLLPGEIGCYASHLAAWRHLLRSGDPSLAIFEDDVQLDPDLPEVIDAVSRLRPPWDVVKLIGRDTEKLRARRRLLGQRDLIAYRRVPSLTGAYVITAGGAQKLLAHRRPFGRPVDVDMRHWWECDLDLLGVHPYPVRGAPSSRLSTIEDRRADRTLLTSARKLALQARYTVCNAMAIRARESREPARSRGRGPRVVDWPARQDVV